MYTRTFLLSLLLISCFAGEVRAQVSAGFTVSPLTGCAPLVVAFTNTTTPASGTTYSWDLGNGSGPDTLTNPGTSYLTAGTYTVTLTATHGSATSTHTQVITVNPTPAVNFSVSDTLICPGAPDTFASTTVAGVPGPVTYLWSFADGYTSTSATSTHAYTFPGYFNITLNATNSDGCASTLTKPAYVHVRTPAAPVFAAANTHICNPPVSAVFSNSVTGYSPLSFRWSFGDGSAGSTLAAPTHTYTATGSYNVGLVVTDGHGCEDSTTVSGYMNVVQLLASYTAPDSVCINQAVTFINTSSPYLTRLWLYGDGFTDTNVNGLHSFHTGGSDTARLVTYNGYCYDTARHPIYVQAPVPTFTISPAEPCPAPVTSFFAATVVPGSTISWRFGDSLAGTGNNLPHTYMENGIDTVKMIAVTDLGCRDTVIKPYVIHDLNASINHPLFTPVNGCVPVTVIFEPALTTTIPGPDTYPASATYTWNWGDGSAPITNSLVADDHTFTTTGVFTVTLTWSTSNGCTGTLTDSIPAGVKPNVTFTATPLHQCEDLNEITFTSTILSGQAQEYYWLFGEGEYNTNLPDTNSIAYHHFIIPGLFSDTLIAYNNGCPDTFIRHDYVRIDSPNANVYPHVVCNVPGKVLFVDSSYGDDSRTCFFGDGTSDTSRDPAHIYTGSMVYNVLFADYNTLSGCRDTSKFTVNMVKPVVNLSCADTAICRDGYAVINANVVSGYANYYDWYADGSSGAYNNSNFIDTFHSTGRYTILLIFYDQNNCEDSVKKTNYILVAKPAASFTVSPPTVCLPSPALFTDASTDVTGAFLTNYSWKFGDNTTAASGTPTMAHTYTATGAYTTTEIVTDNIGCMDTSVQTLVSVFHPYTSFSANITSTCAFVPITFTSVSSPGVSYAWNFGDGTTSALGNPVHAYTDSGTFTVSLVVTDIHGCTDTFTHAGYIRISRPFAAFAQSDSMAICPPFTVHFTNNSTGGISNKWLFGNGDSSVAANPSVIYTAPGYNQVSLIVTNSQGCRDTAVDHVKIFGYAGAFSYGVDSGCVPHPVSFNANFTNVSGLTNITWDFSDGTTVTGTLADSVITHTYLVSGTYLPKLVLSDSACMSSSAGLDTIKIDAVTPGFSATPNPVCLGDTLLLVDTSTASWSGITSQSWTYGGMTSALDSVPVVFAATGAYTVTLVATDGWGCQASLSKTISVYSIPLITVSPDSVICARASTHLADADTGGVWISNHPGIAVVGSSSGLVTGIAGGTAIITYRMPSGCLATRGVTVNAYPDPGKITGTDSICAGATVTLLDTVAGGIWSASNAAASLSATGVLTGLSAGVDTIHYTVANGSCDSAAVRVVTVFGLPDAGSIAGQNIVCVGALVTLTDSVQGGKWASGNPGVVTVDSASGVVRATGLGTAVITYTTAPGANGCVNEAFYTVQVMKPDFTIDPVIKEENCYSDSDASITVTVNGGNPPFRYVWSNLDTGTAIRNLDTGNYWVRVTETATQCIVQDTFVITEPDTLQIAASITEDVCRSGKGSISTTVSGGTGPYSYAWTGHAGNSSTLTDVLTGSYQLTLTDQNGCVQQMTFHVPDTCDEIIIYDAISPNGDGINDTWVILGLQLFPANTVQLFDKWGDVVFSASNYKNDFGGKGKKGELPDGTYYYLVKLNTSNPPQGKDSYTGYLMIKR